MTWMIVAAIAYVATGAFNFWSLWRHDTQNREKITRGDVAFISFFAIIGPLGLGASIAALAGHRFKKWAETEVWNKQAQRREG